MPAEKLPSIEEIATKLEKAAQSDATNEKKEPTIAEAASPELNAPVVGVVDEPVAKAPPKVVEVAPPEPKKDPAAGKFAALARREREARQREEAAQRRMAEIEERAKAIDEKELRISAAKRPTEILKAHGISYADVTQDVLGDYNAPEPDPMDVKLSERLTPLAEENKALKADLAKMQEQLASIQSDRVEVAKREVAQAIQQSARDGGCELIEAVGDEAYTLVQEVIRNFWHQHKKVLSYREACDKVEEYYVNAVSKLVETPKMKSRYAPPTPTAPSKSSPKKEVAERPNTLTQSLTQGKSATRPDIDKLPKHEALAVLATQLRFKE